MSLTRLGYGRPFNRTDLARTPDDGRRYELIDGVLIVTPVPGRAHQRAVARLSCLLGDSCPPRYEVLPGPFAVGLDADTEIRPDVLVGRRDRFTEEDLPGCPELAVEVLSPCTRMLDLHVKRERFERAGTPAYWVVDPDETRLVVWELGRDRKYYEVADVTGESEYAATLPYRVSVIPAELVR
jgi:Uma2 family endonuclease